MRYDDSQQNFITQLIAKSNLSMTNFAKKYGLPLRSVQNWHLGIRECPLYVQELLTSVIEDGIDIGISEANTDIASGIKALRAKTRLTQMKFAEKYHIPWHSIAVWEIGRRKCPMYVYNLLRAKVKADFPDAFKEKDGGDEPNNEL